MITNDESLTHQDNITTQSHHSGRRKRKSQMKVDYKRLAGEIESDGEQDSVVGSSLEGQKDNSHENTNKNKGLSYPNRHVAQFSREFDNPDSVVRVISNGRNLTAESLRKPGSSGLSNPLLITDDPRSLGMVVPGNDLTIRDVADLIGHAHPVNVMDVSTQEELPGWSMADLVDYFESPRRKELVKNFQEEVSSGKSSFSTFASDDGKRLPRVLNQISLEFSNTPLIKKGLSPKFVRDIDWIDNAWPKCRKQHNDYPRVQYYCLTSTSGCYTDFHIDFGGTSVWYHVITGQKIFLLIPPTDYNLERYESWLCSPKQGEIFFADEAESCYKIILEEGKTLIIPTGWIHAVYTPVDSIVFGGNFLHSLDIKGQLQIHCIETRTRVAQKFRFPFFVQMMFYAGAHLLQAMREDRICEMEKEGLPELIDALKQWDVMPGGDADRKGSVAEAAKDAATISGCSSAAEMIAEIEHRLNMSGTGSNIELNHISSEQEQPSKKSRKLKLSLKLLSKPEKKPDTAPSSQNDENVTILGCDKSRDPTKNETSSSRPSLKLKLGISSMLLEDRDSDAEGKASATEKWNESNDTVRENIKGNEPPDEARQQSVNSIVTDAKDEKLADNNDEEFQIFVPQNSVFSVKPVKRKPKHDFDEPESEEDDEDEWIPGQKKKVGKKKQPKRPQMNEQPKIEKKEVTKVEKKPISMTKNKAKYSIKSNKVVQKSGGKNVKKTARDRLKKRLGM